MSRQQRDIATVMRSDLGRRRELVHGFPADPGVLGTIVRGLLVHPLDQPHELVASLDVLCQLAATAGSVKAIEAWFDLYPELQPPADAAAG